MSQTNTKVPGLMQPTMSAPLAGSPRDSAIQAQKSNDAYQNNLINAHKAKGGSRRRHHHYRVHRAGGVAVPQFQMSYTPQGGPGQNPNDIIASSSQTSTQGTANRQYDSQVYDKGFQSSAATNVHSTSAAAASSQKGGYRYSTQPDKNKKTTRQFFKLRKRGGSGNPDWKWGCYSGGKSKKRDSRQKKNKRNTRRTRKTKKHGYRK